MPRSKGRNHFIVKHDLASLEALPNFIWNTGESRHQRPRGYGQVKRGDRWIGFAYTSSDRRERPLSLVTGFFECTNEAKYGSIPAKGRRACLFGESEAWMIEGKARGPQPDRPVGVPPINDLLRKRTFNQATLVSITPDEFEHIRDYVLSHQFDPKRIPLLGREPKCEQEVVAMLARGHSELGIQRILRVQTRFPDLLVKIQGKAEEVHLEVELYSKSFLVHGHHKQLDKKGLFPKVCRKADKRSVAVVCWIDNERSPTLVENGRKVRDCVSRVFELQSLIRDRRKIRW